MRNLHTFMEFVLYEAPQDDVSHKKRPALNASLDRFASVRHRSPQALAILDLIVRLSNHGKCWAVLDLDCPLFPGGAAARRELVERGFAVIQPHGTSQYLYLRIWFQQRLVPEPDIIVEPIREAVLECPASVAK